MVRRRHTGKKKEGTQEIAELSVKGSKFNSLGFVLFCFFKYTNDTFTEKFKIPKSFLMPVQNVELDALVLAGCKIFFYLTLECGNTYPS